MSDDMSTVRQMFNLPCFD